jgi:D-3-phosphoglycerate dehydrogenase
MAAGRSGGALQTRVDAELLATPAIGDRRGLGGDKPIDGAATRAGVMVVNAPTGNTIAAEHTMALMLALLRVPAADAALRTGEWERGRFTGASCGTGR